MTTQAQMAVRRDEETKPCSRCKQVKPFSEFGNAKRYLRQAYCKVCMYEYRKKWAADNRDKVRAKYRKHDLKKDFGMTIEQYDEMLERQGGVCAICQKPCPSGRRLAVDHDHESGAIRALLCTNCNRGLGCFKDDPALLDQAISYLREVSPSPHDHPSDPVRI